MENVQEVWPTKMNFDWPNVEWLTVISTTAMGMHVCLCIHIAIHTDKYINAHSYMCTYVHTVFTWLNTAATISHALKLDVATIQGNVHYIRTLSV